MSPPAPAQGEAGFLAVTVVGPASAADLSAAATLPLAELLPDLVGLVGGDPDAAPTTGWSLSRLGGGPLALEISLAEAGVCDGDILYLRPVADPAPAAVSDLADAVADAVDVRGGLWTAATRRVALALAAAGTLLLATAVAAVDLPTAERIWAAFGTAALASTGGALGARRLGTVAPALLALSGLVPWGLAGASIAGLAGAGPAGIAAGAAAGVAAGSAAAALAVPAARGPAAAAALAAAPAAVVIGLGAALGATPEQDAAVLAAWNVAVAAQLPLLAAGLHLTGALDDGAAALDRAQVDARVAAAHRLLAWLSTGAAAGLAGALVVLAVSAEPWALALAGTASLAAALGSRRQRFLGQGLPTLIAAVIGGLLVELGVAARLGGDQAAAGLSVGMLLASAVLLLGLAVWEGRRSPSALLRRQLRRLESLALIAVVPLGLGALGVYTALGDLGRRLG
jgi:type VII secretion integral membrane protein EccD